MRLDHGGQPKKARRDFREQISYPHQPSLLFRGAEHGKYSEKKKRKKEAEN